MASGWRRDPGEPTRVQRRVGEEGDRVTPVAPPGTIAPEEGQRLGRRYGGGCRQLHQWRLTHNVLIVGSRYQQLFAALKHRFGAEIPADVEFADILAIKGDVRGVLLYAALFCPPTVEINGMIFQWLHWAGNPEKAVQDVQKALQRYGDPRAVEDDINFVQVTHLLALDQQPFSQEEEWLLSGMVADAWRGWLHVQYPDRRFVVKLLGPEETQEDNVGITFYQDR